MLRLWIGSVERTDTENVPLSAYRREKLGSVRSLELRRQMLTAEALLVSALREFGLEPPLDIGTAEGGKPFLRRGGLCFSLSHSGAYAACAVAEYEIGVDIQTPEKRNEKLVTRFFTAEEQRFLSVSKQPDEDFTALWCCKESYLKARGTGLATPLNSFSVSLSDPPAIAGDSSPAFWLKREAAFTVALCALNGQTATPDSVHLFL